MKLKVTTFGVVSVIALTLAVALRPTRSSAACTLPACDLERMFYSDNTFTNQVGSIHITCQGGVQWGSKTNHYDHEEYGDCGHGYGTCGGVDFRCSNGVIISASDYRYVGLTCPTYTQ